MTELTDRHPGMVPASDVPAGGRTRDRALAIYIAAGVVSLVPGLLASARIGVESGPLAPWLGPIDAAMQDIAFGTTLRFWLGVAGATMMGLLLLYPLRKLGYIRWISIAAWFHIHVVFGLFGPILILYHCYFGTGSTPANVALFTTLTVALSGLFGHYVYTRLSADFHGERRRSQTLLQDALADLSNLDASPTKSKLIEDLTAYESQSQGERRGLLAGFGWSRPLRDRRRDLLSRAIWLIDHQGPAQGWSLAKCREVKMRLHNALDGYFAGLSRAARRSLYERIAGYWRLLHLPLFYITVIAASVHVWKVWNMDNPASPAALEAPAIRSKTDAAAGRGSDTAAALARATDAALKSETGVASPVATSPQVAPIVRRPADTSVESVNGPAVPASSPKASADLPATGATIGSPVGSVAPTMAPPSLVQTPRPATRPAPSPAATVLTPAAGPAAATTTAAVPRASIPSQPVPAATTSATPGEWLDALPPGPPAVARKADAKSGSDGIAELLTQGGAQITAGEAGPRAPASSQPRRTSEAQPPRVAATPARAPAIADPAVPSPVPLTEPRAAPDRLPQSQARSSPKPEPSSASAGARSSTSRVPALGGPPPSAQPDPVVELAKKTAQWDNTGKLDPASMRQRLAELKKDPTFSHDKTRFPLTGQHKKVACENCHKATLKDTPRDCIACHRQDDVHRGRRPKCESCHVTTDWGTIRKK